MDWKAYRAEQQALQEDFVKQCRKLGGAAVIAGLEISGVFVTSEMRWAAKKSENPLFVWMA